MELVKTSIVTVIGTCRVHHPLRKMQEMGLIELNNGGMGSFVHSTAEAILRLNVLQGATEYDQQLVELKLVKLKKFNLSLMKILILRTQIY